MDTKGVNEYIVKAFEMYFPSLAERTVKLIRTTESEITALLGDGRRYMFEHMKNIVRPLPNDPNDMTEKEFKNEFAHRLFNAMKYRGVTQEELARLTGVTQPTLSNYLNGKSSPSFYTVDKLAKALNCSVDRFRYLK